MDKVIVIHKGDKKKNIEGTGQVREMGVPQFEKYAKSNGWELVPETAKGGTASDAPKTSGEGKTGTNDGDGKDAINVADFTAKDLISLIKELGAAEDLKKIESIKASEESMEDPRSTVIAAADKFLIKKED